MAPNGYKGPTIRPKVTIFTADCKMSRFPTIPPQQCTEAQIGVHNDTAQIFSRLPSHIVSKDAEGQLLGPYSPLL